MSDKKETSESQDWHWERALLDDYYNHRWHQILDPLCETFQRWKAGEITPTEVDKVLEQAYQERVVLHNLFYQRRDRAVGLIQFWDREWFDAWIRDHVRPSPTASEEE